jgi:uncharacterized RDD family membrane protein YckC
MERNPYAAPKTNVADDEEPVPTEPASRGQRFLNLLIDLVGYFAFAIVVTVVVGLAYPPFLESSSALGDYAFGFIVITSYYALSEGLFGRTLGKLVTRTWVVSESGGKPTFWQILGRSAARSIPFEPFSFFGAEPTGWHDRLSETRVVRKARG